MTATTTNGALMYLTSANPVSKPTGARTPADALGEPKRMTGLDGDSQESTECPSCDRVFDTSKGMKLHHVQAHGESLAGVERTCEHCGDTFRVNPAYVDRGGGRYCSHECAGIDATPGETVERECQACGKAFTARKARVDNGGAQYCSVDCYHGDRDSQGTVERACEECGEEFTILKTQLEHRPADYCSLECAGEKLSRSRLGEDHPNWKGGYSQDRGTDWPELRKQALKADDYQCQGCGRHDDDHRAEHGVGLHVHHIRPVTSFDTPADADTVDNLVPLCRSCHNEWEGIPLRPSAN